MFLPSLSAPYLVCGLRGFDGLLGRPSITGSCLSLPTGAEPLLLRFDTGMHDSCFSQYQRFTRHCPELTGPSALIVKKYPQEMNVYLDSAWHRWAHP